MYKIIIIVSLLLLSILLVPNKAHSDIETSTVMVIEVPVVKEVRQLTVKEMIDAKCVEYKVNCALAHKIAYAESKYKNVPNYLYDGENGRRTAYGIFQITRTTYKAFCGNPKDRLINEKNIECAMKIMKESGVHHWNESKVGWNS